MPKNNKNFVIQNTDSRMFWAGGVEWHSEPTHAVGFQSSKEAIIGFALDYNGPLVQFNAVSRFGYRSDRQLSTSGPSGTTTTTTAPK